MLGNWYFVYGTLLRGMSNHGLIEAATRQCHPASLPGVLYHLPQGYPMLVEEANGMVRGEAVLLEGDAAMAAALDRLEDFIAPGHPGNLYERVEREVTIDGSKEKVRCTVYVCPAQHREWVRKNCILVPGGDWRRFITSRSNSRPRS